ncbi:MAG: sulfate adenylyltransferase subunit CysD [Planctomycetes bacterium]|nr:sulfate adenylyltransferase subunit CysD [Planctomycetota bacterium]
MNDYLLSHLRQLESESIFMMREVAATCERPVLMYSVGKDSSVLLHLARKAFDPAPLPFPLLHIDTSWKFKEMIAFRDATCADAGVDLIVRRNEEAIARGVNPFDLGADEYTRLLKTEPLKAALTEHGFRAAIGGARRDEERSRAKERVFSLRDGQHQWDPRRQRPELWSLFNTRLPREASLRVFPLSNWTELDVWLYIHLEQIPVVPLYFAADRPVVECNGTLVLVDDDRLPIGPGDAVETRSVRFRTLGCYPLTGACLSTATTLPEVIQETIAARTSERHGRVIDHEVDGAMEDKKREGYF